MNACIRAVVRCGVAKGLQVFGIRSGYQGMISGDVEELTGSSVSGIIGRGGTILGTARSKEFHIAEGRKRAYQTLERFGIEGIVACGGNGTFKGGTEFIDEYKIPIISTPGTIDNDLYGTDFTIGYDTAINTAVEAIDKIRDTAESHKRTFFVEVMSPARRKFIALDVGITSGAGFRCPARDQNELRRSVPLHAGANGERSASLLLPRATITATHRSLLMISKRSLMLTPA